MKTRNNDVNDINPYAIDKVSKIPSSLVIIFLKFWAAAAAVFFSVIGGGDVGFDLTNSMDETDSTLNLAISMRIVIFIALVMTLFMNYIVRPLVRLKYSRRDNTYKYNMVNCKGFKSFLLAFPYYLVISIVLYFVTIFLSSKGLVIDLFNTTKGQGIEPFTYGFCFIIIDSLFVMIKDICLYLYKRHRYFKLIKGE